MGQAHSTHEMIINSGEVDSRLDSSGSCLLPAVVFCDHGNESSVFVKGKKYLDWVSKRTFLKYRAPGIW
jgi:hypothetical protein